MPDAEYGDLLKRQILEAYGFDETMTPQDRELWDAYGRLMDALKREEEAAAARVIGNAKAITAYINAHPDILDELTPGAGAVMAEHGLRFEWSKS